MQARMAAATGNAYTHVASSDRFYPLGVHGRDASGTRSIVAAVDFDTAEREHRTSPERHLLEYCC